jgi:DNA-binding transcriptional LysR family regulator
MPARIAAPPPRADDLLVLLAVGRTGRFLTAARELGVTHTTIARRIEALEASLGGHVLVRGAAGWRLTPLGERAVVAATRVEEAMGELRDAEPARTLTGVIRLSATDGFSAYAAAPAMAALRRRHPDVALEVVTVTRQASTHRGGVDLEVVVGRPVVQRAVAVHLADYALGLYASPELLERYGRPERIEDLAGAPLVYFIESLLHVDELDAARRAIPDMFDVVGSTNVFVHVEATREGAGFGLLPAYLGDREPGLVRVLPDAVEHRLPYWLVARREVLERPLIAAYLEELHARLARIGPALLGSAS